MFFDLGHPALNISNIKVRYEKGIRMAVEYLYSLGHRRIAFINHHVRLGPLQVRRKTFVKTVSRYGDEVRYSVALSSDSPAGGRQATHQLLSSGLDPTAIVCVNDFMAIGALLSARFRSRSFGDQILSMSEGKE